VIPDHCSFTGGLPHPTTSRGSRVIKGNISREIPSTINTKVNMKDKLRIEFKKKMLSNRVRAFQGSPIDEPRVPKTALRAGGGNPFVNEMAGKLQRDSVNGMTLRHC
jgi:hypothetical protein